jgi:hypothetical protein
MNLIRHIYLLLVQDKRPILLSIITTLTVNCNNGNVVPPKQVPVERIHCEELELNANLIVENYKDSIKVVRLNYLTKGEKTYKDYPVLSIFHLDKTIVDITFDTKGVSATGLTGIDLLLNEWRRFEIDSIEYEDDFLRYSDKILQKCFIKSYRMNGVKKNSRALELDINSFK